MRLSICRVLENSIRFYLKYILFCIIYQTKPRVRWQTRISSSENRTLWTCCAQIVFSVYLRITTVSDNESFCRKVFILDMKKGISLRCWDCLIRLSCLSIVLLTWRIIFHLFFGRLQLITGIGELMSRYFCLSNVQFLQFVINNKGFAGGASCLNCDQRKLEEISHREMFPTGSVFCSLII